MKRILMRMAIAVILLSSTFTIAQAQYSSGNSPDGEIDLSLYEIDLVSGGKVIDRGIIGILSENAPSHYQAGKLPRFAIMGREKQFYLGIGGYVRGTVAFDWGNPINNPNYFITSNIKRPDINGDGTSDAGNGGKTQISMGTTNLFFNFVAMPGSENQIGAYIDFNFDKAQYGLDLKHAYMTWRGFMAGYNYSIFADQQCIPTTVDFEGAPSLATVRTSMLSWSARLYNMSMGIAIESPIFSITEGEHARLVNQRMPSIPLYIKYAWSDKSHTRVSAIMRNIQYRNMLTSKNKDRFGWGVQLSGVWNVLDMVNLYYQGVYGDGVADYIQDLSGMHLDMVPDPHHEGKLKGTQQLGYMGGIRINYSKNLFSNHMYSQVRNYAKNYKDMNGYALNSNTATSESLEWGDQYKYGQYLCNNIFYTYGQLQLGLEHIWGARKNMGGEFRHDNRIQFMAQINF